MQRPIEYFNKNERPIQIGFQNPYRVIIWIGTLEIEHF